MVNTEYQMKKALGRLYVLTLEDDVPVDASCVEISYEELCDLRESGEIDEEELADLNEIEKELGLIPYEERCKRTNQKQVLVFEDKQQ
jgi:hypothetical protein